MTSLRFPLLALTLALTATGCTADEGEVCFIDGDCSSGLTCCKTTASATARGRCLPESDRCSSAPIPDAGGDSTVGDGGASDASDATTDAPIDSAADAPPADASMPCDPGAEGECGMGYCRRARCTDTVGQCTERPARCDGVLAPVCACSGDTYTSLCEAERAGASVDRVGTCDATPPDAGMDATADAADATTD